MDGRAMPDLEDVAAMALPELSHRVVVNLQAEAEGVSAERLVGRWRVSNSEHRETRRRAGPSGLALISLRINILALSVDGDDAAMTLNCILR
jgi:hypothetical protein